jgi:DnaK suppressor protein
VAAKALKRKTARTAARPAPKTVASKVPAKPVPPRPKPPAKPPKKKRRLVTPKEAERYRTILLDRQHDLMQAYHLSKGDRRVHPDSGTEDYIDYAVSSYAKEFLLSLSEMDRKQLLLVREALLRLDREDYGACQQCSDPIAAKRLEVAPWARYCLRCQALEEQGLLPQYPGRLDTDDAEEDEAEEAHPVEAEEEIGAEDVEELEEEPLGEAEEEAEEADE